MNKKILFLDIDGVLNSHRSLVAANGYPLDFSPKGMKQFDMVGVGLIRRLCSDPDTSIVLSSTWRLHFTAFEVAKALDLPVVGVTPNLPGIRGLEINAWLSRHPEVERYAIVDDDSDMLPDQLPFFVKTSGFDGITWRNYQDLCVLFGRNEFAEAGPLECELLAR